MTILPRLRCLSVAAVVLLTACQDQEPATPEAELSEPRNDGEDDAGGTAEADAPGGSPDATASEPEPEDGPDLGVALTLTEVATGGSFTAAATGPDGRLYVGERAGTVHPVTDAGLGEAVVDLSAETTTDGERGLLGLAFAPEGDALYVSTTDLDGGNVVTAVPLEGSSFDPESRRTVYTLDQPRANHNGGDLTVGPDGLLYLGIGDGGGAGDPLGAAQDLTTPLGSIVRIDPTDGDPFGVPDDNPFVDTDGASAEIFAYGLRNPWRFSFDTATDELWIADVGQNAREEINRVTFEEAAGANFGWNAMEGTSAFAGEEPDDHVPPVYEYDTGGAQGCSITGGYVYRGAAIPELTGVYLYADFCNGTVRGLLVDDGGAVVEQAELGIDGGQVVSFAQDADGEVYVLDLGGRLLRIDRA